MLDFEEGGGIVTIAFTLDGEVDLDLVLVFLWGN